MKINNTQPGTSQHPENQGDHNADRHDKNACDRPAKPTWKSIQIGQIDLHPGFAEFTSAITKITFDLKSVREIKSQEMIKMAMRHKIRVIQTGGKFHVVEGIRGWQIAASTLPPKTKIEVIVVSAYSDDEILASLINEIILTQMLFRSSLAGGLQLVQMYGEFSRDPRFKTILDRIFSKRPTKDQFAEILGLRPTGIYQKGKNNLSAELCDQDATEMNDKEQGDE